MALNLKSCIALTPIRFTVKDMHLCGWLSYKTTQLDPFTEKVWRK